MVGTVYKSTGSWYLVKTDDGTFYESRIKGKFRIQDIKSTNPVAVGDKVEIELDKNHDKTIGVIKKIIARKNYIVRKSVNLSKQLHIIASNIDTVFLLITINNPPTLTGFIDRFLVTAEAYGIKAVLLFHKVDSYNEDLILELRYLKSIYKSIGYTTVETSVVTQQGLDELKALMQGKTSMFSGHSGVGKSSLINAISPKLNLKTKEISEQHMQGQHTTTFAEMFDLDFDARIIDTPGIRGFGIVEIDKYELGGFFPEFFALKPFCKFNDCLHIEEPECAVKNALEKDELPYSRYKTYLQIIEGDNDTYRTDIYDTP